MTLMDWDTERADTGSCLTAEQLIDVVERGRRSRYYHTVVEHVIFCPTCRATYKEMLATEQLVRQMRRARWRTVWRPAFAFGMVLVLATAVWWLLRPAPSPAGLRWVNGAPYEGAVRLPDWARSAVALFENPPSGVRNAPAYELPIRLKTPSPRQAVVETLTPNFEWEPLRGAAGYRVSLMDASGNPIPLRVEKTRAQTAQPLREGETYTLLIVARVPDALPGEEPRLRYVFRTLSAAERERYEWARAHAQSAPLTSAMIFYQLGFYEEARRALPNRNDDPRILRWKEVLERE